MAVKTPDAYAQLKANMAHIVATPQRVGAMFDQFRAQSEFLITQQAVLSGKACLLPGIQTEHLRVSPQQPSGSYAEADVRNAQGDALARIGRDFTRLNLAATPSTRRKRDLHFIAIQKSVRPLDADIAK